MKRDTRVSIPTKKKGREIFKKMLDFASHHLIVLQIHQFLPLPPMGRDVEQILELWVDNVRSEGHVGTVEHKLALLGKKI